MEGAGSAGTAAGVGWRGRLHHGAGGAELVAFRTPGETCCHAARCARRQLLRGHLAEELGLCGIGILDPGSVTQIGLCLHRPPKREPRYMNMHHTIT